MALYFKAIVDAILDGRDQPDHRGDLRRARTSPRSASTSATPRISIGLVIDAVISFIVVAFFLFLVVKAYNNFKARRPRRRPSRRPRSPC